MKDTISWLVSVPASDNNFISALNGATVDEIRQAIQTVGENKKGVKTKMRALERGLKKLEKQRQHNRGGELQ